MNKTIRAFSIATVLILAGAGCYGASQTATPQDSEVLAEPQETVEIIYTDNGFSPGSVTVAVGGTVTFKNESSNSFWPASAVHPAHKGYPTRGGCLGSTFDACESLPPGSEWSFTFDETGEWGYHNHLSAGFTGTIIVK